MDSFDAVVGSAERVRAQDRIERIHEDRLVAHDEGEKIKTHVKRLEKVAGGGGASGDQLVADLGLQVKE